MLRSAIRRSLRAQGFHIVGNRVSFRQRRDKRSIRKRHEHAVEKRIVSAEAALAGDEDQLLGYIASGNEVDLNKPNRPLLVVDVSRENTQGLFWNERIQGLVIKRLLDGVNTVAEAMFKENKSLNALVVIDEAHRLAPRALPEDDDTLSGVRSVLIDAARTTRKYGLGWMFISQTLSSLHTEILHQLRISFFGFGLALGSEYQSLSQLVGGKDPALELYRRFRDPHSSFDTASRQYSFMTIGPVSPLSFAGTPLFLNVFNSVEAFMKENNLSSVA